MDPRTSVIDERLKHIKRIIAVASGKGGVGKSLIASGLALYLSQKGYRVGLLDLDVYGPSTHIILGVSNVFPQEEKGIIPPQVQGIRFMSPVFFTNDKPTPLRGINITNIIIELLAITQWGPLDYLIIDMPPGIGDETLDVIRYIKRGEFLVVTTPSKVAMGAVSKLLKILREMNLPVLGVVENMAMISSPSQKNEVVKLGFPFKGSIAFDTHLEEAIGDSTLLLKTTFMNQVETVIGVP